MSTFHQLHHLERYKTLCIAVNGSIGQNEDCDGEETLPVPVEMLQSALLIATP